jgi:hypothetical protein
LWKKLKRLLPGNTDQPSEVSFEGTTYEDPTKISEKFNIYFIDSIKNIVDILKCKPAVVLNNNREISEMNTFKLIDMRDLKSALAIMKNTGGGESGITTSILKDSAEVIADRFIDFINYSLTYGKFSEEWKTSVIIPVQKVSKTKKCEEFRPINTKKKKNRSPRALYSDKAPNWALGTINKCRQFRNISRYNSRWRQYLPA